MANSNRVTFTLLLAAFLSGASIQTGTAQTLPESEPELLPVSEPDFVAPIVAL